LRKYGTAFAIILSAAVIGAPTNASPAPTARSLSPAVIEPATVWVSHGSTGSLVEGIQKRLSDYGYAISVDGVFGPQTDAAVRHWQRANGLLADGIVGPITWTSLFPAGGAPTVAVGPPPVPSLVGDGCDVAADALRAAGASEWEVEFGTSIAYRESRCTLGAVNTNSSTGDYSWGPWQVNYIGALGPSRTALLGPPASNTSSWFEAASNFLTLGRTHGWCHWDKEGGYCS
jgi:hypothetical protein